MSESAQPIKQEHALGCAVACVAFRCGIEYRQALSFFEEPGNAWLRGYFCPEIVSALAQGGLNYRFESYEAGKHSSHLERVGTIVFIEPCERYTLGHYLIRSKEGWMNSWVNCPRIVPVESAFERVLPGQPSFIIWEAAA